MNELIKEFARQCRDTSPNDKALPSFNVEKFAELIVRECLKFECEAGVYTKHDMADAIKRHFRVEP
jgi:hypothetical protein